MMNLTESAPWLPCSTCGTHLPFEGEADFVRYFRGEGRFCAQCGTRMDCWDALLHGVMENFALTRAYVAIGAHETRFQFDLAPFQVKEILFAETGISPSAVILSIHYTPSGQAAYPVELHGNVPTRTSPKQGISVYGRPVEGTTGDAPAKVDCKITWVEAPEADDGWSHLMNAYRKYAEGDWRSTVSPANIAAELALTKAVYDGLVRHASKADTDDLLSNGATYSHQLRVLLPLLAKVEGVHPMNATVLGELTTLRKLRNALAHGGATAEKVERHDAARLIVAATFAFQYSRFFRQQLSAR